MDLARRGRVSPAILVDPSSLTVCSYNKAMPCTKGVVKVLPKCHMRPTETLRRHESCKCFHVLLSAQQLYHRTQAVKCAVTCFQSLQINSKGHRRSRPLSLPQASLLYRASKSWEDCKFTPRVKHKEADFKQACNALAFFWSFLQVIISESIWSRGMQFLLLELSSALHWRL